MRGSRFLILVLMLGMVFCGCEKERPRAEDARMGLEEVEVAESEVQEVGKEASMGITIQWLGHASFKISYEDTIVYIDPWKIKEAPSDATLVLVSHSHL